MDFNHSRHSDTTSKIFPRRLPNNFHGNTRPRVKLASLHQAQWKDRSPNPQQSTNAKVTTWQKKRFPQDVIAQRRQMIVHPGKLSAETPEWLKTTYDYFRRSQQVPRVKQTRAERERFDVLNRQRKITYADKSHPLNHRFSQPIEVTGKIGWQGRERSTVGFTKDVSPKVGSVESRDFSIRKPQLKIGKTDFVDTYSPF